MSEIWGDFLEEINKVDHKDESSIRELGVRAISHFVGLPLDTVKTEAENLAISFKGFEPQDGEVESYLYVLGKLLSNISPEQQFVVVKVCVAHMVEDIGNKHSEWRALWALFAGYNSTIKSSVQKRQLRSLAKKLLLAHPGYLGHFINEQLVLIPERARLARMERYKHFRERNPRWLTSEAAK